MAARLIAHRDGHAVEIGWLSDGRLRRNKNARGRHRIGVGIELAMAVGGGHVDRPMAGAAYRSGPALLEGLISADLIAQVVPLAFFRAQIVADLVVKAL